jgi:DNA-binding NtrC family response regulator
MKKRILIADDEQGIRDLFRFLLEEQGFEVFTACDGMEAVEMVEKHTFDLVFLDVHMPKMRGPEAIKKIKEINPEQIVVIFSSSSDPYLIFETQAEQNGAFECLYKPFSIDSMLNVIKRALGERKEIYNEA